VKVPIQNLYYLFCYAWKYIPDELAIDVGSIQSPDVLHLCAHVLAAGTDRLLRRGLDRGYRSYEEDTSRLRGRIDITSSARRMTWLNARMACQFDELSPDILHNQILRTTVRLLSFAITEPALHERLRQTDNRLAGINTVELSAPLFRRVQVHRNNSFYAFLMRVCELVHSCLLPDRSGDGPSWFRDVLSDEVYMAAVFEEFIRNFYHLKQSEFTVRRTQPKWHATASNADDLQFLPKMTTDVTLSSQDRAIIIDAKYYRDALQEHHGARKIHSGNLYQLMSYLRATSADAKPGQLIEGALVYPVGEQSIDCNM
jgi:5-methylcytosine-specific restriction enzyme subunit McrC